MAMTKKVPSDFSDLVAAFEAEGVEYLIVGGYAVGAHARPRATKDLDLWIGGGENLERVARALRNFGLPDAFVDTARTLGEGEALFFGTPPVRVDLLRSRPCRSPKRERGRSGCRSGRSNRRRS